MPKIYTKTGDKGKTSLFNGQRISKADLRVDAYGTVDELNSAIGVVIAELLMIKDKGLMIKKELVKIQNDLLDIGSVLANLQGKALRSLQKRVKKFEDLIDQMTAKMPPLKNFILPGGGKTGALLHLARAICRRAERKIVELSNKDPSASFVSAQDKGSGQVNGNIIIYLNRLSDLLFTMARFANFKEKKKEIIWKRKI